MAVPETYDLVLPLLEVIKDKDEYKVKDITEEVMEYIDISDEDKEIRLPNNEPLINSRISTANTYLKKAELIESNRFMYFNITEEGLNVLADNPDTTTSATIPYVATNSFFTMNLNCVCCIRCLNDTFVEGV